MCIFVWLFSFPEIQEYLNGSIVGNMEPLIYFSLLLFVKTIHSYENDFQMITKQEIRIYPGFHYYSYVIFNDRSLLSDI